MQEQQICPFKSQLHDISAVVKHLLTCTKHNMKISFWDLLGCINIAKRECGYGTSSKVGKFTTDAELAVHSTTTPVQECNNNIDVLMWASWWNSIMANIQMKLLTREYWSE